MYKLFTWQDVERFVKLFINKDGSRTTRYEDADKYFGSEAVIVEQAYAERGETVHRLMA